MARIECPHCKHLFEPEVDYVGRTVGTVTGGAVGGIAGGMAGAGMGIALLGTAISGLLPVAIIGGLAAAAIGHGIGKEFDTVHCPKCQREIELED